MIPLIIDLNDNSKSTTIDVQDVCGEPDLKMVTITTMPTAFSEDYMVDFQHCKKLKLHRDVVVLTPHCVVTFTGYATKVERYLAVFRAHLVTYAFHEHAVRDYWRQSKLDNLLKES